MTPRATGTHHATATSKRRARATGPVASSPRRTTRAAALPQLRLSSLPAPGVAVAQAVNVIVPVINNTPIRGLLDKVDPVSDSSGVAGIRLLGAPVSTTLSPDGTRLYVVTEPITSFLPLPLALLIPASYSVTEIDTKTNKVVGVPVAVDAMPVRPVVLSPDGARAYLTMSNGDNRTRVATINTVNSTAVRTVSLAGSPVWGVVGTPDGEKIFQETMTSNSGAVTVNLLNGRTGTRIGKPLQIAGYPEFGLTVNPDGSRAYQTTLLPAGTGHSLGVTVVNTTDNTVAGFAALDGMVGSGVITTPDGAHVVQVSDGPVAGTTAVTMLDPATGATVKAVVLQGYRQPYVPAVFVQDGRRFAVLTSDGGNQSRLTILDAADGTIIGSPVAVAGGTADISAATVFGAGGDRLYFLSQFGEYDADGNWVQRTVATVIDTTDSTMVGTPVALDDNTRGAVASPDGSRVLQALNPWGAPPPGEPYRSGVAFIRSDGTLIAPPVLVDGWVRTPGAFSPDGSRAYQLSETAQSVVTAIDTNTGAVIGAPVTVNGTLPEALAVAADGARVYATTKVTVFRVVIPFILWPLEYSVSITHVNAIEASAYPAPV
jgi:DNA-binding beta-propeller fold protein YncE